MYSCVSVYAHIQCMDFELCKQRVCGYSMKRIECWLFTVFVSSTMVACCMCSTTPCVQIANERKWNGLLTVRRTHFIGVKHWPAQLQHFIFKKTTHIHLYWFVAAVFMRVSMNVIINVICISISQHFFSNSRVFNRTNVFNKQYFERKIWTFPVFHHN